MPYRQSGAVIDPLPALMQYSQTNPWYNPFMKGPDYVGGIRSVLNEMKQRESLKAEKAQKEFENILEMGKLNIAGGKVKTEVEKVGIQRERLDYEKEKKPNDIQAAQFLVESGAYDNIKEAYDAVKGRKSPTQLEEESMRRARGAGTGKFAPTKPEKPTTYSLKLAAAKRGVQEGRISQDQYNQVEMGLTKEKEADELKRQTNSMKLLITRMNKEREILAKAWTSTYDDKEKKRQELRLINVENALAKLDSLNAKLVAGTPLSQEELIQAAGIIANLNKIKEGKYDLESNLVISPENIKEGLYVNPQTGEEGAYINGKWIPTKKK